MCFWNYANHRRIARGFPFHLAFSAPDLKLDDLCEVDMACNHCLCIGVSITKVPIAKIMQSLREWFIKRCPLLAPTDKNIQHAIDQHFIKHILYCRLKQIIFIHLVFWSKQLTKNKPTGTVTSSGSLAKNCQQ